MLAVSVPKTHCRWFGARTFAGRSLPFPSVPTARRKYFCRCTRPIADWNWQYVCMLHVYDVHFTSLQYLQIERRHAPMWFNENMRQTELTVCMECVLVCRILSSKICVPSELLLGFHLPLSPAPIRSESFRSKLSKVCSRAPSWVAFVFIIPLSQLFVSHCYACYAVSVVAPLYLRHSLFLVASNFCTLSISLYIVRRSQNVVPSSARIIYERSS